MARAKNTHSHIDRDSQDAFGYREYIEPLAQQLFDGQDGFTLGIFGGWGQGKTSLMKLLHERVAMRKVKVLPIWFDAWKFDRADVVWRALLAQTVNDIEQRLDKRLKELDKREVAEIQPEQKKIKKRAALEAWRKNALDPLKSQIYRSFTRTERGELSIDLVRVLKILGRVSIQTALPGGSLLKRLWDCLPGSTKTDDNDSSDNLKADVKTFQDLLDVFRREESQTYFEHIRFLEQFQDKFRQLISEAYKYLGVQQLIFFIDDLDRCEPDKAIEVLDAIKLFLSTPKTVFVIGVDDEAILQGLQRRYGDLLQRLEGSGKDNAVDTGVRDYHLEYLEKIVQLPFTLPALPEDDITRYVRERLSPELQDDLVVQVIKLGCQYNPRKLNRTCHLLNLNWEITKQRKPEVCIAPVILAKLVIIQLRHREMFRALLDGKTAIPRRLEEYWRGGATTEKPKMLPEVKEAVQTEAADKPTAPEEVPRGAPGKPESIIAPYLGLSWLRDMLMWQPDNREQLRKADPNLCITFDDLARFDPSRINEHIELKQQQHRVAPWDVAAGNVEETAEGILILSGEAREWTGPDRNILERLLHEDLTIVESACNVILPDERGDYANHLLKLLEDPATPWRQRVSAGDALGFLGDPRFAEGREHWVEIAAGEFYRSSRKDDPDAHEDEIDGKRYSLDAFQIGRYPVTNAEYRRFVEATDHEPPQHWREDAIPLGRDNHPVLAVSWHDANAYVAWLNERGDGHDYALPTEAQWERAARGPAEVDGKENRRIYPWGDEFDPHRCNVRETGLGRTTAVGCFPDGASPEGVRDLSGNVWEWCLNEYDNPERTDPSDTGRRVLRGGSWNYERIFTRAAFRLREDPRSRISPLGPLGFRVVRRPPS